MFTKKKSVRMSVCVLNCLKSQDNSLSVNSFCRRPDRSRTLQWAAAISMSVTYRNVCVCVYALCILSHKKQGLVLSLTRKPRIYTLTDTARHTKRWHGLCSDPHFSSAPRSLCRERRAPPPDKTAPFGTPCNITSAHLASSLPWLMPSASAAN